MLTALLLSLPLIQGQDDLSDQDRRLAFELRTLADEFLPTAAVSRRLERSFREALAQRLGL